MLTEICAPIFLEDYVSCLSTCWPGVQVTCIGDSTVYENITWVAGPAMPTKAEMDVKIFERYQLDKVAELSCCCNLAIVIGFESSGLGTPHHYDGETVDQINLIGAFATVARTDAMPNGGTIYYAVRPIVDGVKMPKEYVLHNRDMLHQVVNDGANWKLFNLQKFNYKRNYVMNETTTFAEVEAITWESLPN